ncbi:polyol transporter 1 [Olea europaea subsp. europaea]|uniref:Polyol transporter 1 n=1 Tax=Olea europaea subsp. europaea TaxID=158383 RepID=A0A8S0QE76_OLEEU|nr:polyol transporter 1 [Olea europaea subsp. europaea]
MWAIVLCVLMTLSCVAFFSMGIGPIVWVYNSEIFSLRLRAQRCGLRVAMNRFMSGVLLMSFISLYKSITIEGAFFLFVEIAIVAWIFFYILLPETQGRTLKDMENPSDRWGGVGCGGAGGWFREKDGELQFKKLVLNGRYYIIALYISICKNPLYLEVPREMPFAKTPLHIAASKGRTSLALEILRLKPMLGTKLNLALCRHITTMKQLIGHDPDLICVPRRGGIKEPNVD